MTWQESLLRYGKLNSMCAENISALKKCKTKADAVKLYKKTIDWALERGYPTLDFLRQEFSENQNEGLFIDHTFNGEILNEQQVYIFHNCKGTIKVGLNPDKAIIPMLYFANGCDMKVESIDGVRILPDLIPLYIFGGNKIIAGNDRNAHFRIYREEVKYGI